MTLKFPFHLNFDMTYFVGDNKIPTNMGISFIVQIFLIPQSYSFICSMAFVLFPNVYLHQTSYLLLVRHTFFVIFHWTLTKKKLISYIQASQLEWVDGSNMFYISILIVISLTTCKGDFLWRRQRKLIISNGHSSLSVYCIFYDRYRYIWQDRNTWKYDFIFKIYFYLIRRKTYLIDKSFINIRQLCLHKVVGT